MPYPTTINSELGGNFGLKAWKIECVDFQDYTFVAYGTEDCSDSGVEMTTLPTPYNNTANLTYILLFQTQIFGHTCAYGPKSNHCPYYCLQWIPDSPHQCTYSYMTFINTHKTKTKKNK